jgi:hypothetical protein
MKEGLEIQELKIKELKSLGILSVNTKDNEDEEAINDQQKERESQEFINNSLEVDWMMQQN